RFLYTLGGYRTCRMNPAGLAQFRIERSPRKLERHRGFSVPAATGTCVTNRLLKHVGIAVVVVAIVNGVVKKWIHHRGFGFITTETGDEIFCHVTALKTGTYSLSVGDSVGAVFCSASVPASRRWRIRRRAF